MQIVTRIHVQNQKFNTPNRQIPYFYMKIEVHMIRFSIASSIHVQTAAL